VLSLAVAERRGRNRGDELAGRSGYSAPLSVRERAKGLGVVIEYANSTGEPVWRDPGSRRVDIYAICSQPTCAGASRHFRSQPSRDAGALNGSKFDTWTINGDAWPKVKPMMVETGKAITACCSAMRAATSNPMHLHRHSFEVTKIDDKPTSGLMKDVVNVMPLQTLAVDFIAEQPGRFVDALPSAVCTWITALCKIVKYKA